MSSYVQGARRWVLSSACVGLSCLMMWTLADSAFAHPQHTPSRSPHRLSTLETRLETRLKTLRAESALSLTSLKRLRRLGAPLIEDQRIGQKLTAEQPFEFDITLITMELDSTARLPTQASATVTLTTLADLESVKLFIFEVSADDVDASVSYDGVDFTTTSVSDIPRGAIEVSLPEPVTAGRELKIKLDYRSAVWASEGPPSVVAENGLSHLVSSAYLPFSGNSFYYDFAPIETRIEADASLAPAGLGIEVSRPEPGEAGTWVYRAELPTLFYVYANGGAYPLSLDGRVEVFHPRGLETSESASVIEQNTLDVADFYTGLYGFYPFSRLGVAPISDRAGAAIGPQAQILLPTFFWYDGLELDTTFDRAGVIYHEVGHQYFFNAIRLDPGANSGTAWLSESFAELSSLLALDGIKGSSAIHRSTNFHIYLTSTQGQDHPPLASREIEDHPNYFEVVYLLGSTALYGLRHRFEDYDVRFRECVRSWQGFLITADDMYACWQTMTPKPGYQGFDLGQFIERYLKGVTLDEISVSARYLEGGAELTLDTRTWSDALEVVTRTEDGEVSALYSPRGPGQRITYEGSSARVDPIRTTPRRITNLNPADVDLNGVVDGQDALDVLFHGGADIYNYERVFPAWADVDQDQVISGDDLTEVVRQIGSYLR